MVDTIHTGNGWSRVSSPPPVKKVKRRHENHPERDFQRDLKEKEKNETPKDGAEGPSGDPQQQAKKRPKNPASGGSGKQTPAGIDREKANNGPGKVIDIRI